MIVQDVMDCLEALSPLAYAEDFDNVGLLVGDHKAEVSGVLVTLDTLEPVIDEAIAKNCNLVISFHPIIFKSLKTLTGKDYVQRAVLKAIKNEIAIYAIHTALDNHLEGVNNIICDKLDLRNKRILIPQKGTIKKLTTYVQKKDAESLRAALFDAGAGNIGNYEQCSFNTDGIGTFKGNAHSNPKIGKKGELRKEAETQISLTYNKHIESKLLQTLFKEHPYDEVAFEVIALDNIDQHIGIGMIGELKNDQITASFLNDLKQKMQVSAIRHSKITSQTVKKIAVLGGSGSFAISAAKQAGADVLVTADLKYHDYFTAEGRILLVDIGHYESEQYTKNFLVDYLSKKITNFAPAFPLGQVILSTTNTNPVKYL